MRVRRFGNGWGRTLSARQSRRLGYRARALQHRDDAQLVIGVSSGRCGLRQPMWGRDPAIRLVERRHIVAEVIPPQLLDVCTCCPRMRGGFAAMVGRKRGFHEPTSGVTTRQRNVVTDIFIPDPAPRP